jgi:glycosyltransferase involved in cell wall biosynthesis
VTTRIGGTAEIITHAECLVPPGNPDALAEQLRYLINSPEHLRAIGRSGPERAKSLCDPAKQINELHRTLIGLTGAVSAPVMS